MTPPPLPAELAADVRKAGLGLLIVAALPAFVTLIIYSQGTSSLAPLAGLGVGVVLAVLGGLTLKRSWPALYVAAILCAGAAIAITIGAIKEGKFQGLILTAGTAGAAAFFLRIGAALRAHVQGRITPA